MNHYANKKSAAESMLDIALLMANASQLKAVVEQGPSFSFYVPIVVLISISLILQVVVGVLLIFIGECLESETTFQCIHSQMPYSKLSVGLFSIYRANGFRSLHFTGVYGISIVVKCCKSVVHGKGQRNIAKPGKT